MRVVHVTDSYAPRIGGIERQVAALAAQQISAGHDVTVVTAVPGERADDGVEVVRPRLAQWQAFALAPLLRRLVRRGIGTSPRDDLVVHAHLSVASPLAVHAARFATRERIPTAITVHSMWPSSTLAVRAANLPHWNSPIRATWSAVSTVAARQVSRVLPRAGQVLVVPNLVDTEWWRPHPGPDADPGGEVRIVTVGRLAGRKRVGPLLDVLAQVRGGLPARTKLHVTIVGDGPRRAELARHIERHAMAGWVRLAGQLTPPEIRALLHRADLFVAPARRESFGIAALEARSAGVPVVGFRESGLADFITHGTDGLLVADDAELAGTLTELAVNEVLRHRLRHAARQEPPLGVEAALRALDELYQRALGHPVEPLPEPAADTA